jgi:hypothetical protein
MVVCYSVSRSMSLTFYRRPTHSHPVYLQWSRSTNLRPGIRIGTTTNSRSMETARIVGVWHGMGSIRSPDWFPLTAIFARVYVTDLAHFEGIELSVSVPEEALRFAAYLRRIVRAATAVSLPGPHGTALPCRRRPEHRPCPGRLIVDRQDIPPEIAWECPSCGEGGVISGWRGSSVDLSADRLPPIGACVSIIIPETPYRLLLDGMLFDVDAERVIYSAQLGPDGVVLTANDEHLEELAGYVAFEANHAKSRAARRRWDEIFEALDSVLRR